MQYFVTPLCMLAATGVVAPNGGAYTGESPSHTIIHLKIWFKILIF